MRIMARVDGKVAIVTGGAGGIGAATCRMLAREGAHVIVTDIADGQDLAREVGGDFRSHDVTSETRWSEIVGAVEKKHGRLDILVNAAGIEGDMTKGTPETSLDEWKRVHAINLDGTFLGCKAVMSAMRRNGGGSIINLSSAVALMATPASAPYGSSKAAVKHLSGSVASFGAADRIRCNSVHPGLIRTRMLDDIHATRARAKNISFEESRALSLGRVPMGMLGEPEDVANLILFLASDESRYMTGAALVIDGGWSVGGTAR
jgi:NAD(P)-dependent dehydrogenase (short-subunit alcohol dehydrogenase family)